MHPYVAWALALMTHLQPPAITPWASTYETTARAFVDAAEAAPVYGGSDGVARTLATDVAVAWFESRFDPEATGDRGASIGLFQIARPFAPADDLRAPARAAVVAQRLFLQSFRICKGYPALERLGWYADGGAGCGRTGGRGEAARAKSLHRLQLASRLLEDFPPPIPLFL